MLQLNPVWKYIKKTAFSGPYTKWLTWTTLSPLLLLVSSITIMVPIAPQKAFFLILTTIVAFVVALASKKMAKIALTLLIGAFTVWCCTHSETVFSILWMATLILGLITLFLVQGDAKSVFEKENEESVFLTKESALWKNRFEILREKMDEDKEILETEIEGMKEKKIELEETILSMRKLAESMHKESIATEKRCMALEGEILAKKRPDHSLQNAAMLKEVEELRKELENKKELESSIDRLQDELDHSYIESSRLEKAIKEIEVKCIRQEREIAAKEDLEERYHQLEEELAGALKDTMRVEALLKEAESKLGEQQEVVEKRRERNTTLLATSSSSHPISLKDIAKKVGKKGS